MKNSNPSNQALWKTRILKIIETPVFRGAIEYPTIHPSPKMTLRRSARATKGKGWSGQILPYLTETISKEDAGEEAYMIKRVWATR